MDMVLSRFILLFCLLFASFAVVANGTVTERIRKLVTEEQYAQAFELAQQYSFEFEGNSEFDFYYGLSALQTGQFDIALFNFERLTSSYPLVPRYRLELARCYFYLDHLERAKKEFNQVLANNPPNKVKQSIQFFTEEIEKREKSLQSRYYGSFTLAGGYDSNINSATNADNFQIPFAGSSLLLPLSSKERQQESAFLQAKALLGFSKPISRFQSYGMIALLNHKANLESSEYNLSSFLVQADYRHLFGKIQLRPTISASRYLLDNHSLQQDLSIGSELYWYVTPNWQPYTRLSYTYSDNRVNPDFDRTQPQAELGLGFSMQRFSSQFSVSASKDNARHDIKAYMRDTLGINFSLQYQLNQHELYGMLSWQQSDYQSKLAVFDAARDETLQQALIGYRYRLAKSLSLYVQASYLSNDSNISLYQYRRSLSETGLSLAF